MAREYQDSVDTSSIIDAVRNGNYEEDYDGASDFEVCLA